MCHEQFHRSRFWDRQTIDPDESSEDQPADERPDDDLPSFLSGEEPDEDIEILTGGGDEA